METAYDGRQVVGMDLHWRGSAPPAGHDPLPGGRIKDALQAPATPAGLPPGP